HEVPSSGSQDTALARRLHEVGRLPAGLLRGLLDQARAGRGERDALADLLLSDADPGRPAPEDAARQASSLDLGSRPAAPLASTSPGARYGDYRVLDTLGHGGMGQVLLVEHVSTRARYALKTLPDDA